MNQTISFIGVLIMLTIPVTAKISMEYYYN